VKRNLGFVGVAVGLIFIVLLTGCGNSVAQKEKEYKDQWTQVMTKFETRVTSDDSKANDLVTKNDIVGLRSLITSRSANVSDVLSQVLKLNPPEKYQRVQITTLYYLMALKDQLKAQNDVNDAALANSPTTDLKTISDGYSKRTQMAGQELALELKKAQLTIGAEAPKPSSSTPKSTTPSK
jgi:hypothetical protein